MELHHPSKFKRGTRVLMCVARKKDTGENKTYSKMVTYSQKEFDEKLILLRHLRQEGQRIYSTASSLNEEKAIRRFREAQLAAEYATPLNFYQNLETRWISALMKSEDIKNWLFDCDTPTESLYVEKDLKRLDIEHHSYRTKNGRHYITRPFNPETLRYDAKKVLQKNALMLWSY